MIAPQQYSRQLGALIGPGAKYRGGAPLPPGGSGVGGGLMQNTPGRSGQKHPARNSPRARPAT